MKGTTFMRPSDYKTLLVDLLDSSKHVDYVEDLKSRRFPYIFSTLINGVESRWQVYGQLADGASHDHPTPAVNAEPMLPYGTGETRIGSPAWISGLIGATRPVDVASISVWAWDEGSQKSGLTIRFRNGEKVFVRMIDENEWDEREVNQ